MRTTKKPLRTWIPALLAVTAFSFGLFGCGDGIHPPSAQKLAAFENAGPGGPSVDMNEVVQAHLPRGPYRVYVGDVLELQLPSLLYPDVPQAQPEALGRNAHVSRVGDSGMITLPDGRQIRAVGKTLAQVEADVVDAYYPTLVKTRPAVYAQVTEYARSRVRIMGAVTTPGLYELRYDQMSLVGLLMAAGGILDDGAAVIRVIPGSGTGDPPPDRVDTTTLPSGITAWPGRGNPPKQGGLVRSNAPGTADAYVSFQCEGPLETTGWLSVRHADETVFRQWLDIGSSRQRWTALGKIDAVIPMRGLAEMDLKLSSLARLLTARARGRGVHLAAYEASGKWSRHEGDVFMAALEVAPSGDRDVMVRTLDPSASPVGESSENEETTVILPVKGMNIPFADVPLREGDTVIVERLTLQTVSVLGLVNAPGSFPYPPGVTYNLGETLALAGGLDLIANPRYVSVYRPKADGTVASATFQFVAPKRQEQLTQALTIQIKPGDIVSVEHTPRTRANVFFDRIVRISLGWYLYPDQFWGNDD